MNLKVFAVYDAAIGAYAQPFYMTSIGEAKRGWTEVCKDPSTKMNKYPGDFSLFYLGDFDESSGVFHNLHAPEMIATALNGKYQDVAPDLHITQDDTKITHLDT